MSMSLRKQLQFKKRNFKSEYLFHTRFVVANLVTSVEIHPICCAIKLCYFGQIRNGSLASHFSLLKSSTTSSAAGDYVANLERFGQNEEPALRIGN